MRIRTAAVWVLALSTAHAALARADAAGDAACVEAAVTALQRRYEAVRDVRADIVQTSRSVALGSSASEQLTSKGSVVLAKPGKMRWSYEEPEPSLVVSDGETLWIYDPALREAQKLPATQGYLSGAAVEFLLGVGEIRRAFEISAIACDDQHAELRLVPREPSSYERLEIAVDPRSGDLSRTTVFFVLGNATEIAFSNIELNLDPAPDVFRFEPPPDVRVIELDAP